MGKPVCTLVTAFAKKLQKSKSGEQLDTGYRIPWFQRKGLRMLPNLNHFHVTARVAFQSQGYWVSFGTGKVKE